jgi:hypothetical protein
VLASCIWFPFRGPCFQATLILCVILLLLSNIILAQMILGLVPLPVTSPSSSTEQCIEVVRVRRAEVFLIDYVWWLVIPFSYVADPRA